MRLTNDIRKDICDYAVLLTMKKRSKFLVDESDELAKLVYDRLYPPTEQAMMNKLPDNFFHQKSEIYIRTVDMKNESDKVVLNLKSSRKIAAKDYNYRQPCWEIKPEDENAVTVRIAHLIAARLKFASDKVTLTNNITKLLAGFNTLKQLQDEWPDGIEFYKNLTPSAPIKNLPAIRGVDVTSLILSLKGE